MNGLYHTTIALAILLASPYWGLRALVDSRFRAGLRHRLRGGRDLPVLTGSVWIHASSVGEVRAAQILIRALQDRRFPPPLVLSTFTPAGYELARDEGLDPVFRLPLDFPLWLNPVFEKIRPSLLVLIESEFWPSLLRLCLSRGVPVVLVNGRVSEKSHRRYRRVSGFFRWITEGIRLFSMRSDTDAERLQALGIGPDRVRVTGNLKFDAPVPGGPDSGETPDPPVLVFGSTRPGDEGPIMDAVLRLREEFPELSCVLAPRHLDRCEEVEGLIRHYGLPFVRHTQLSPNGALPAGTLILLDRMGDLTRYYARGTAAFVGGGFNPRFGGQNILEPARFGLPVVYGKHMNNFEEEARLLQASGGGIRLEHPSALYAALHRLLSDPVDRRRRGRAAEQTVKAHQGAVGRNVEILENFLQSP